MQIVYYTVHFFSIFHSFFQNPLFLCCKKRPVTNALSRIFGIIVASSAWVLPSRILLVGANPQAPRSALRAGCAFFKCWRYTFDNCINSAHSHSLAERFPQAAESAPWHILNFCVIMNICSNDKMQKHKSVFWKKYIAWYLLYELHIRVIIYWLYYTRAI